jgi:hypothetical protein
MGHKPPGTLPLTDRILFHSLQLSPQLSGLQFPETQTAECKSLSISFVLNQKV